MKDFIQILLGVAALTGFLYGVFKVESAIYKSIDDLGKLVHTRINSLERDLALHIAVYSERKQNVDYLLHALEEKIDHVKVRLLDEIKELKIERNQKRRSNEDI